MTDKEKKELKDGVISIFKRFNILDHTATIGSLRDDILRYINSLQEEPVSKVWHNTNEIPNYNEDDMYSNQILVFGKSSVGQGCSVCSMIDKETIYAPISHKEYNWGECPFTMWAYISDVLRVQEEPVSPCENCEGDGLAGTCASISELGRCPLKYRKKEEPVQ